MADYFAFGSGGLQEAVRQVFAKLKTLLDGKYTKPAGGIPASDMAAAVQTSLGKADTALQAVPNTYRTAADQDVIDSGLSSQISAKLDSPATAGTTGQIIEKSATGPVWADRDKVVTVTGTTPTITAQPGVRYVCGEVTTLDITLPSSGIVDVTFESGSTATVLTVMPPTGQTVRWANGFDPDNLAENTSYQIRVTDGTFGVADASGADSGAKSLGITGAQVGDFVKVKAVDANGVPTAWEPYEWHHTTFAITSEDKQTKAFTIKNSTAVSEILVLGTVLFDSYDGFNVSIGYNTPLINNALSVSSTNRYIGMNIKKTCGFWMGIQGASQWSAIDSRFTSIARPYSANNIIDDIKFGSMWLNKTMLVGTSLDVYWR